MKYEKWSLGYWFLKQYIALVDWFIHRRIIITGKEKIPRDKPIVFAPNHQNALSDPMAILLNTRFQPVWLARADLFGKSKMADTILKFLKIMPVYRLRDGKQNLDKNEKTFDDSIKVLENNFALALFPEAAHSGKRQMLVHKKAIPRIVFMAEEKTHYKLDIQIIPVGIYYNHYWKFDRTVIVNFGESIPVKDYLETFQKNPNTAVIALKTKIHNSILPLTINIKSKKHYLDFERIREIYGSHFLKNQNKKFSVLNLFKSDQILAARLDELEKNYPEEIDRLVNETDIFYHKIKILKLRSWLVARDHNHSSRVIRNTILLLVSLPVFVYGLLFNAIPFFVTDQVIRKKVKDKTFWSTFFLVAGIMLFPVFYLLELIAISWFIPGFWLKMAFLISLPFSGKAAFKWYILLRKTIGRCRMLRLQWLEPQKYQELLKEKEQLFEKLDKLTSRNYS